MGVYYQIVHKEHVHSNILCWNSTFYGYNLDYNDQTLINISKNIVANNLKDTLRVISPVVKRSADASSEGLELSVNLPFAMLRRKYIQAIARGSMVQQASGGLQNLEIKG